MAASHVIFREHANTHKEIYLNSIVHGSVEWVNVPAAAMKFHSAKEAHAYANRHMPLLASWRVGLRSW